VRSAFLAVLLSLVLLPSVALPARAAGALEVRRVARPEEVARLQRLGRPAPLAARPEELRIQAERDRRWFALHDVLSAPGVDWSLQGQRRADWRPEAHPARDPRAALARTAGAVAATPPETLRVAFIRIDFLNDRGVAASTGSGRFDLSSLDTSDSAIPIDPAPHNRAFFQAHLEALKRYYDATSYGRVIVRADTNDVWPHEPNGAYSLSDMADYGPWTFSQEIYGAAVHMLRDMFFAADSQSRERGDAIPWRDYDRFFLIHAGSDLQSDVRQDSKEDIPSFTVGVEGADRVVFQDTTLAGETQVIHSTVIDRATIVPELAAQDGYYGAINGVIAHEAGHNLLGLADLYNVTTGYPVVGYWSLMDSGNLLGSRVMLKDGTEIYATGLLPPSVDAWQRAFTTDILAFPEVDYSGDSTAIENSERHPDVRRVTLSSDEYLLLENRYLAPADVVVLDQDSISRVVLGPKSPDRYEYDALLPGGGILVWHIDESVIPFGTSLRVNADFGFNTNPLRLGVSVLESDGLQDLGDTGSPYFLGAPFDPWFRSFNDTLSDRTFPNLIPHIGTRPHKQLAFLDDPAPVMGFSARRMWERAGWPIAADFPSGGPLLLAVDADGDRQLDVCWAGGRDSIDVLVAGPPDSIVRVRNPDRDALFAVRPDGSALGPAYAFAHLDSLPRPDGRPRPELAALPVGEAVGAGLPAVGPAYFAVSTYAAGADTSGPGGRVWLLDHLGQPLPGWPPALSSIVTTPPVIAGRYPNAEVFVGCADGTVYGLGLGGEVVDSFRVSDQASGPVAGRLAVAPASSPGDLWRVAAGTRDGWIATGLARRAPGDHGSVRELSVNLGVQGLAPDFLWNPFDGAARPGAASAAGAAGRSAVCGAGVPALVVHHADRLWAFCPDGTPLTGWGHSFGDTLIAGLGAGDPDGDGYPEVLTQNIRSGLAFVNRSGYPSPGWPKRGTTEDLRTGSPPLALDVDGDARSEIVGMNASGIVAALRADGKVPEGWPLASGSGATGSPVAADLDRDGLLDLVAPDRLGLLFAYALPVAVGDPVATSWTMMGGDPGRSSSLAANATPVPPLPSAGPLVRGSLVVFPNPARRQPVQFAYRLTEPADVEFRIFDTSGHEVASFSRSGMQAENREAWDPGTLPAGLYLARLRFRGAASEGAAVLQVGVLR
jgi:M6 family metalloprotease-like protein